MQYMFKSHVKRWRNKVKGKVYVRYIINVPREIGEMLKTGKKYIITISGE